MAISFKEAYQTLLKARSGLNDQNIACLPKNKQLLLVKAQQCIYLELQHLQIQKMTERVDQFEALTDGFQKSEQEFRDMQKWAAEAAQAGEIVNGILKGMSFALSLF